MGRRCSCTNISGYFRGKRTTFYMTSSKSLQTFRVCRARCADHFDAKILGVSSFLRVTAIKIRNLVFDKNIRKNCLSLFLCEPVFPLLKLESKFQLHIRIAWRSHYKTTYNLKSFLFLLEGSPRSHITTRHKTVQKLGLIIKILFRIHKYGGIVGFVEEDLLYNVGYVAFHPVLIYPF